MVELWRGEHRGLAGRADEDHVVPVRDHGEAAVPVAEIAAVDPPRPALVRSAERGRRRGGEVCPQCCAFDQLHDCAAPLCSDAYRDLACDRIFGRGSPRRRLVER